MNTSKGKLLSAILFPEQMVFKYDEELPIVMLLLLSYAAVCFALSLFFQVSAKIPTFHDMLHNELVCSLILKGTVSCESGMLIRVIPKFNRSFGQELVVLHTTNSMFGKFLVQIGVGVEV